MQVLGSFRLQVDIEEMVRQYIAENILFTKQGYPHPDEASFLENSVIDSMNVMGLIVFLEETLEIQVEDCEILPDNVDSVSRLAAFARRKQALST
jgi:acyl carrier protein